jgi:hypothetical protein
VDRSTEDHRNLNSRTANTLRKVARGGAVPFTATLPYRPSWSAVLGRERRFIIT